MIILPLLAALLVVHSLTATMLAASAALARLAGDRRAAVEADLTLESTLARARVEHDATLNTLPPGHTQYLAVAAPAGWSATTVASREPTGELLWLVVEVQRRDPSGTPQAGRRGTLILAYHTADTAIVIDSRPRF